MSEAESTLTEVISFRLSKAFVKKLRKYSKGKIDDYGRELNENRAARKIVIEALVFQEEAKEVRKKEQEIGRSL